MGTVRDRLGRYRKKRDLGRTPEPAARASGGQGRRFVIQKHDASSLHYDFRLEVDGVLKSWAVPRGPSTDPREKRLAIRTEDHPLDYADFEGVIPEAEYGGGTVMVWDAGGYRDLRAEQGEGSPDMAGSLESGLVEVWLEGAKLKGGYALKRIEAGAKSRWLLVKMDDREADARRDPVSTENRSVRTGCTLREIVRAAEDDP